LSLAAGQNCQPFQSPFPPLFTWPEPNETSHSWFSHQYPWKSEKFLLVVSSRKTYGRLPHPTSGFSAVPRALPRCYFSLPFEDPLFILSGPTGFRSFACNRALRYRLSPDAHLREGCLLRGVVRPPPPPLKDLTGKPPPSHAPVYPRCSFLRLTASRLSTRARTRRSGSQGVDFSPAPVVPFFSVTSLCSLA